MLPNPFKMFFLLRHIAGCNNRLDWRWSWTCSNAFQPNGPVHLQKQIDLHIVSNVANPVQIKSVTPIDRCTHWLVWKDCQTLANVCKSNRYRVLHDQVCLNTLSNTFEPVRNKEYYTNRWFCASLRLKIISNLFKDFEPNRFPCLPRVWQAFRMFSNVFSLYFVHQSVIASMVWF